MRLIICLSSSKTLTCAAKSGIHTSRHESNKRNCAIELSTTINNLNFLVTLLRSVAVAISQW